MKLRTAVLAALLSLVVGILLVTAVSVSTVVERSARESVTEALERSNAVILDVLQYQQAQLENDALVVADEPRIRALFGGDVDLATIRGSAQRLASRVGTDLFLLSDEDGYLLADVAHPDDSGQNLLENPVTGPVFSRALKEGNGSGVWTKENTIYRVQAQQIRIAQDVMGAVLLGAAMTDAEATVLERQVGSSVVLSIDGKVAATSEGILHAKESLEAVIVQAEEKPTELSIEGRRYLVQSGALPAYVGNRSVTYLLLRDLEVALSPGRRVQRILYAVFGGAVFIALLLSMLLARKLSKPLVELVGFTEAIADGSLEPRKDTRGPTEVRALAESMNRMVIEIGESRKQLAEKERLEQELEIATRIQTSILPSDPHLDGFDIGALMIAADEVGGDYYDILPTQDGGWIAIGDVSGHGLDAGLVMMMVQTSVATAVRANPDAKPSEILALINRTIYENLRDRLDSTKHMTLSLFRSYPSGRLLMAGAHMDLIVVRRGADVCEEIRTPGTWIGLVEDISDETFDTELKLGDGDLLVLYTDGVTEATSSDRMLFGYDRLCESVLRHRARPANEMTAAIAADVARWQDQQLDDLSLVVARRSS